jgi:hypothetical protein
MTGRDPALPVVLQRLRLERGSPKGLWRSRPVLRLRLTPGSSAVCTSPYGGTLQAIAAALDMSMAEFASAMDDVKWP